MSNQNKKPTTQDIFGCSYETLVADHHHKQVFIILIHAMQDFGLTTKQINKVLQKVCNSTEKLPSANIYECDDNSKDELNNILTESLCGLFGEAKKLYQVYPEYFDDEVSS